MYTKRPSSYDTNFTFKIQIYCHVSVFHFNPSFRKKWSKMYICISKIKQLLVRTPIIKILKKNFCKCSICSEEGEGEEGGILKLGHRSHGPAFSKTHRSVWFNIHKASISEVDENYFWAVSDEAIKGGVYGKVSLSSVCPTGCQRPGICPPAICWV